MAFEHRSDDPVYAPNSFGRGYADEVGEVADGWEADGAMVRQAYTLRADDDDFSQAGTLVREVWDDEQREQFVQTVAGHLLGGVEGDAPGGQPEAAKADAGDPVVESGTHAG